MIGDKKATDAIGYRSAWTAGKRLLVYFFKFDIGIHHSTLISEDRMSPVNSLSLTNFS